jgi:hypothetical protein
MEPTQLCLMHEQTDMWMHCAHATMAKRPFSSNLLGLKVRLAASRVPPLPPWCRPGAARPFRQTTTAQLSGGRCLWVRRTLHTLHALCFARAAFVSS